MSPGRLDPTVVHRHLAAIDEAVQILRRHQGRPVSLLRADREKRWIVEHGLQLCSQNALDVATHIVASRGRDVPDYATAIDGLAELGILAPDFAQRFRQIAGFRNLIVHGYMAVDVDALQRLLDQRLDDFVVFARQVADHLAGGGE